MIIFLDRGITSSEIRQASSATGHSDSDSDDTNHNCESCDSSGERDEINERIVAALERIQQDMNRVLRRLETMEDVMALRQEQHSVSDYLMLIRMEISNKCKSDCLYRGS